MKVNEFVKASYLSMTFRQIDTDDIIYEFIWGYDEGDAKFLALYGDYTVLKFRSVADCMINVYIEKQEEE